MTKFAIFTENGFADAFYAEDIHGARLRPVYGETPEPTEDNPSPSAPIVGWEPNPDCSIPLDAVEITDGQWMEFLTYPSTRRWQDGQIVEYTPPSPEPEPKITVVPAVVLWERMTNAEAEQVEAAMSTQPFRIRQIFMTAQTFRSDHELWPLLEQMATQLFGPERAAELLE